jgi:glycyl-tRNA synthetase alpha subunit
VYNNQIQLEKVEAFKKENEAGNAYFFFQQKEIKMLSTLFRMSAEEFQKYWKESLSSQAYLTALQTMKHFSEKEKEE